jgi:hypothetical protein
MGFSEATTLGNCLKCDDNPTDGFWVVVAFVVFACLTFLALVMS